MPSLKLLLREHAERFTLWLPVFFAAGIALYFALPREPQDYVLASGLGLLAPWLGFWRRGNKHAAWLCLALSVLAAGACWAKFMTDRNDTRMLAHAIAPRPLEGTIEALEYLPTGIRITLQQVRIADMEARATPQRVRLSLRVKKLPQLEVGARIALRAGLLPPMGPVLRGSFDFSRYFFFRGIGAVGYGLMPVEVLEKATPQGFLGFWQTARHHLARDIRSTLSGDVGAIATGLIVGDDTAISQTAYDQLRAANLLHIIAISGAHMVVIGGVVFVALRLLMLPFAFGLTPRAKQLAAALTLLALSAYLCITGIDISATRAYIMMALMLASVMLLREVQPMRSLALTAFLMLLLDPSDMLEPGFQLSFAATMAMVAVVEMQWQRTPENLRVAIKRWPLRAAGLFVLFSVSAELATMPLVVSMFNQFAPYGMAANLLVGPLVTFILMPAVALYFVLLPLGWQTIALQLMGFAIEAMLGLAEVISHLPHALMFFPSPPAWAVAVYALGLCWLCLWQTKLRWAGLLALPVLLGSFLTIKLPDMVVSSDARHVAYRSADGYVLAAGRASSLVPELMANALGEATLQTLPRNAVMCESGLCSYKTAFGTLRYQRQYAGDVNQCALPVKILVTLRSTLRCEGVFVINGHDRQRSGAYALWRVGEWWKFETTRQWQGDRPWSAQ